MLDTKSLLIVEDEAIVALDMSMQLSEMGYRVVGIAGTGADAIKLARDTNPDLVLMDISLRGDMDGIDAARYISRTLLAPVIFLTAFSDLDTIRRAAQTGPYGYLTKPFSPAELHATLEVALYKSTIERKLLESEQWFSATLRCVGEAVIAVDPEDLVTFMNPIAEKLTGWSDVDAKGRSENEIFPLFRSELPDELISPARQVLERNEVIGINHGVRLQSRSGERVPVDNSAAPIRSDDGRVLGAVVVMRDVSERLRQEEKLRSSEERFYSVFEHAPVGMALVALGGRVLQVNRSLCTLLDLTEQDILTINHNDLTFIHDRDTEERNLLRLTAGLVPAVQFEKRYSYQERLPIWTLTNVSILREGESPLCLLYQVHDLTERKKTEAELVRLAFYDSLTGLGNRSHLRDELNRLLAAARRNARQFAVIMLDLDRFKYINDVLGHEAGDELLKIVSERLRGSLREEDIITRMGGDEFIILLDNVENPNNLAGVLEKIRQSIAMPMQLAGREISITTSLGVCLFPIDGQDSQTLLRHADSAMYAAKSRGPNRFEFFRPELGVQAAARLEMQSALRQAMSLNEFSLHYQPIVKLANNEIAGFEALMRWCHEGVFISPAIFIPLAEESGMIQDFGTWILEQACEFAASWPKPYQINVNCSAYQIRDHAFADQVTRILAKTGLPPNRLCLELTESVFMDSDSGHLERLASLKARGVTLSIDDYGTGYSSLAYLKTFGAQSLKIDALFVRDMVDDPNDAAIVSATISMAHKLGLRAVAEGVETSEQLAQLREYGCDMVQGYYLGMPAPSSEAMPLLIAGTVPVLTANSPAALPVNLEQREFP